jgi:integrase
LPRLTKSIVDRAKAGSRDLFIWDDSLAGFGLRVKASGVRSYICQYRNSYGRSRRLTLGQHGRITLEQARKLAGEVHAALARGEDPAARRSALREAPGFEELADYYRRHHAPMKRASSVRADETMLRLYILPRLGKKRVADIGRVDIAGIHVGLKETPYAANRTLALLSKMFALAMALDWRSDNPARGIPRFHEERRERWLSDDEISRLIDVANRYRNQRAANAVKLLLLSGARRNEVLSARWEEFDFQRATWTKPSHHTKQRKVEHVPLSAAALRLLAAMRAESRSEFLFPGDVAGKPLVELKTAWARICKMAALDHVRLHDLRHTFASSLVSSGTSLHIVGRLLGHTQPQTTARYAHLSDDALRHAANRFGSKLAGLNSSAETKTTVAS